MEEDNETRIASRIALLLKSTLRWVLGLATTSGGRPASRMLVPLLPGDESVSTIAYPARSGCGVARSGCRTLV